MINRQHLSCLRGSLRMAVDATHSLTGVAEKLHRTIVNPFDPSADLGADRTGGIAGLVYRSIRGGTRLIGHGIDAGLGPVATWLPKGEASAALDAYRSVVNGVYGDHLASTANPLALDMSIRDDGRMIDVHEPIDANRIILFVHGLCMNDAQWCRDGQDPGAALAQRLGYHPLHLRYNTGLSIADNGRRLAGLLQQLASSRDAPFDDVVIIGHSMGGLVARSACHYGDLEKHTWPAQLDRLFFLGTPHHGAPLEQGGHVIDSLLGLSPYSVPFRLIGMSRSAGITDLRHGHITEQNVHVPLPKRVKCYAVAAARAEKRSVLSDRLVGDGLVPLDSALGRHRDDARTLAFPSNHQWVSYQMGHIELIGSPDVFEWIGERF